MKTEAFYLEDSYLKEWEAEVIEMNGEGRFIVLDKTAFYPQGGGQPNDTGIIERISDGEKFNVIFVGKFNEEISHEVELKDDSKLEIGDKVRCVLDWERRYKHMRMHTAVHILSEVLYRDTNALVTGGQLGEEKSRMDFNLENYDRDKIDEYFEKANEIINQELPVTIKFISRKEAMNIPQISKLSKGLSEELSTIRVVNIGDFDIQADGGTHVSNTSEIGKIKLLKVDNKGKNNRRIYFTLE